MGIDRDLLDFKLPEKKYKVAKSKFYQQLLDCWFAIRTRPPMSSYDILNGYLLCNQNIQIGGSCLTIAVMNGMKQYLKTRLLDIVDNNGNFLEFGQLQHKLPIRISNLEYYGLQKSIKKDWLDKIKSYNVE